MKQCKEKEHVSECQMGFRNSFGCKGTVMINFENEFQDSPIGIKGSTTYIHTYIHTLMYTYTSVHTFVQAMSSDSEAALDRVDHPIV